MLNRVFEDFLLRLLSCLQYFPRVFLSFGGRSSFMSFCLRCYSHQVERNGANIYVHFDIRWLDLVEFWSQSFLTPCESRDSNGKKIYGRKLAAPKKTKRRTKQQNKKKVCLYLMGIYLARQLLGPIQRVQPQILWLIVRYYAISFRGPNCSF